MSGRSGYGGSSWAFQFIDPQAGWDAAASKFKVHLGLKEYAKLRETRESPAFATLTIDDLLELEQSEK
jgi:hypothetical protein